MTTVHKITAYCDAAGCDYSETRNPGEYGRMVEPDLRIIGQNIQLCEQCYDKFLIHVKSFFKSREAEHG
jgi:hypothetical protein